MLRSYSQDLARGGRVVGSAHGSEAREVWRLEVGEQEEEDVCVRAWAVRCCM